MAYVTVKSAAIDKGCSVSTIRNALNANALDGTKASFIWLVKIDDRYEAWQPRKYERGESDATTGMVDTAGSR